MSENRLVPPWEEEPPMEPRVEDASLAPVQMMPVMEAEDVATVTPGLGVRLRDLDGETRREVMEDLRAWVEWFCREYEVNDVPACWFRHRGLTQDLYAMRCAELKAWEEGAPNTVAAFQLQPHIHALIARLRLERPVECLDTGEHVSARWKPKVYDESDWASFLSEDEDTQEVQRGNQPLWARRSVVAGEEGEQGVPVVSAAVPVDEVQVIAGPSLSAAEQLAGGREAVVLVSRASTSKLQESWWETAPTPDGPWTPVETSRVRPQDGTEVEEPLTWDQD